MSTRATVIAWFALILLCCALGIYMAYGAYTNWTRKQTSDIPPNGTGTNASSEERSTGLLRAIYGTSGGHLPSSEKPYTEKIHTSAVDRDKTDHPRSCTVSLKRVKMAPEYNPIACEAEESIPSDMSCQGEMTKKRKLIGLRLSCCKIANVCNENRWCGSGTASCYALDEKPMCTGCDKGFGGDRCNESLPSAWVVCQCYEERFVKGIAEDFGLKKACRDAVFGQTGRCIFRRSDASSCVCDASTEIKRDTTVDQDIPTCSKVRE